MKKLLLAASLAGLMAVPVQAADYTLIRKVHMRSFSSK